jgi:hypothetical protein
VLPPRQPMGDSMREVQPSSRAIEIAGNPLPDWRLASTVGGWSYGALKTIADALSRVSLRRMAFRIMS